MLASGAARRLVRLRAAAAAVAAISVVMATLVVVAGPATQVGAQGDPYSGPITAATGPAYFGPAPNPVPYCDSPTYFDPFPENINPVGRLAPGPGNEASVTTAGVTMDFNITAEGDPNGQYPGFFPAGGEGVANDQPKGVEMAAEDAATVSLSAPLFYSQWVFTDVDRENEGFFVTPNWTAPGGQVAIFGGDPNFTFAGANANEAVFNDTDTVGLDSEDIGGRVQVDFLGVVTGISMERDVGSGQSGFAVGGGCEAAGAAKTVVAGPTWNGDAFEVTYDIRVRNNLPSTETLAAAVLAAQQAAPADFLSAVPDGIELVDVQLQDQLGDVSFSDIEVVSVTNPSGGLPLNPNYDGLADDDLLGPGASVDAETNELVRLEVRYTPDLAQASWDDCAAGVLYSNQAMVTASAANIDVEDQSDDGVNPAPGEDNGEGGVDDPTIVEFPCPPAQLEIVKTVVEGPDGTCPDFSDGVVGDGPALVVDDGDTVTYCISIYNPGTSEATNVVISDPQNPNGDVVVGVLGSEATVDIAYDLVVDQQTPTVNTATATGQGPDGALPPASDTAVIAVDPLPAPNLRIVKTVVEGPNGTCPASYAEGVHGAGAPLQVDDGDTVTYCMTVRNLGPGDATGVVISDPLAPAGFDGAIGALAAMAEATRSFDMSVTTGSPRVNTATVNGDGPYEPADPDSDDAIIDVDPLPDPDLNIVKTVVLGPNGVCPATYADGVQGAGTALAVTYGQTVTYCLTVQNSGGAAATDVVVTDPHFPAGFDGTVGDLAIGAEATLSFDLVVDAATVEINTATVEGNGPNGAVPPDSDQAVIDASPEPNPVLAIVKTVVLGPNGTCPATFADGEPGAGAALNVVEGQTVTYCIAVTNTGGSTATDVVISDPHAPAGFDGNVGSLAVGAEVTRSFDLVVTANTNPLNTARVTGNGPNGGLPSPTDQAVINVSPEADPVLDIVKTVVAGPNGNCPASFAEGVAGPGSALPVLYGETVTYCITVTNTGANPATSVVITDPHAPAGFDGNVGTLAVGAEVTRSFDLVVDATTPPVNTATVNGSGPNGPVPGDSDEALINASPQPNPVLQIVKTVVAGPNGICPPTFAEGVDGVGPALAVVHGDTVTYCITVTNTGGNAATGVVITDPQEPAGFNGVVGSLGVGAEVSRSYDLVIDDATPAVNTATVNGFGPNGVVPPDNDSAQIAPSAQPNPILEIVKTVVRGPDGTCPAYADGVQGVGSALSVIYGDTVTYCLTAQNRGLSPATDVVISDPQAPAGFSGNIGTLNAGSEVTVQFDIEVTTDTPVLNTARVDGEGPNGSLPHDLDEAQIAPAQDPDPVLDIIKTVVSGPNGTCPSYDNGIVGVGPALPVLHGETVTYCMSVANHGLSAATNVQVFDVLAPDNFDGMVGDLAPDTNATVSFDLVITGSTPAVNTALVTGEGPNGPVPGDSDTAQIISSPQPVPVLDLVKTAIGGPGGSCPAFADGVAGVGPALEVTVGDVVTYCITVRNTGRGGATDVVVTDPQAPTGFDGAIGDLAPNQEATVSFDVEVTEDTELVNTATGSGNGPDGPLDPVDDIARITVTPVLLPELSIVKTVVPGPAGTCPSFEDGVVGLGPGLEVTIGDTVTYCVSVRNVGDGQATNVVITDTQAPAPFEIATLDPGATHHESYDITVTDDTPLINTAVGQAQGPNGEQVDPVEDQAQIIANAEPIPTISLTNTVIPITESCNDAVESVDEYLLGRLGDGVRWCFEVTNTGNTALSQIDLTDTPLNIADLDVLSEHGNGGASLQPGASIIFGVDGAIPADGLTSLASVIATPSEIDGTPLPGLGRVTDTNDAAVGEIGIRIDKTVAVGADADCATAVEEVSVDAGDEVTWCFTVTNTGAVALMVEEVVDETLNVVVPIPEADQNLAPDESVTVSHSGVVDEDIENVARATGVPVDDDGDPIPNTPPIEDDDTSIVDTVSADLSIIKTVSNAGPVEDGAELTYTLVVANAGPDTARDVRITDDLALGVRLIEFVDSEDWQCVVAIPDVADPEGEYSEFWSCDLEDPLPAGASVELTYTARLPEGAEGGTEFDNVAKVTSSTPDPDLTNNTDDATTYTLIAPTPEPIVPNVPNTPSTPEYPGPFEPPAAPPPTPPLVITGTSSPLLIMAAITLALFGGVFQVAGRRRRGRLGPES